MNDKNKQPFPFDERNQQDFLLVTKRIQNALDRMANDQRIKRTEINLAKLAGCSRGTLRNRQWPIAQLRKLQEEARRATEIQEPEPRAIREKSRIERYRGQLSKNRDELLVWKYKHDELLDKVRTLEAQRDSYKRRVEELEIRLQSFISSNKKGRADIRTIPETLPRKPYVRDKEHG